MTSPTSEPTGQRSKPPCATREGESAGELNAPLGAPDHSGLSVVDAARRERDRRADRDDGFADSESNTVGSPTAMAGPSPVCPGHGQEFTREGARTTVVYMIRCAPAPGSRGNKVTIYADARETRLGLPTARVSISHNGNVLVDRPPAVSADLPTTDPGFHAVSIRAWITGYSTLDVDHWAGFVEIR